MPLRMISKHHLLCYCITSLILTKPYLYLDQPVNQIILSDKRGYKNTKVEAAADFLWMKTKHKVKAIITSPLVSFIMRFSTEKMILNLSAWRVRVFLVSPAGARIIITTQNIIIQDHGQVSENGAVAATRHLRGTLPTHPETSRRFIQATVITQKLWRMSLLTLATVSLYVPHPQTPWDHRKGTARSLQLTASLPASAADSSTTLGTAILTPPAVCDDTPSSTLSPLFAWRSLCDVQKELAAMGCHLKREAGHWGVSTHISAPGFTPSQRWQPSGQAHHLVGLAKCNEKCLLNSQYSQLHKTTVLCSPHLQHRRSWRGKPRFSARHCWCSPQRCGALREKHQGPNTWTRRLWPRPISCSCKHSHQNFSLKCTVPSLSSPLCFMSLYHAIIFSSAGIQSSTEVSG